jgi:DNA-binding MarR family transcriptional regulator
MVTYEKNQANAGRRGPDQRHARPVSDQQPAVDGRRSAGGAARFDERTLADTRRDCRGDRPQPVAWLACDLGANRQNVQRIVNDLHREGLVAFEVNPHHRRAQLVMLTEKGRRAFEAAMELQAPWVNDLSDGLSVKDIATVHRVVTALRKKLEGDDELEERA